MRLCFLWAALFICFGAVANAQEQAPRIEPHLSAYPNATICCRPTIAALHEMTRALPPLPSGGITIHLNCALAVGPFSVVSLHPVPSNQPSARATSCVTTQNYPLDWKPFIEQAKLRASVYVFNLSDVPETERTQTQSTMDITISPSDIRPTDFTATPPLPSREVQWARGPTAQEVASAYPPAALAAHQETDVTLLCQVQTDHSVVCIATAADPALQSVFEAPALGLSQSFIAARQLRGGGDPVGAVVQLLIRFKR